MQDGHIDKINGLFLFEFKGSSEEYGAGLELAIERGWLWQHKSATFVKFPPGRAIRVNGKHCTISVISREAFR